MKNITIHLEDGRKMKFELNDEIAPITVANFVGLVQKNFFDGLCFHRVINNFMIQGGGFYHKKTLEPKEGAQTIKGEFVSNGVKNSIKHEIGTISMARTNVKDSASSQFFICTAETPFLNGEYAGFGKVSDKDSEAVAIDISNVKTTAVGYYDDVPVTPIVIKTITLD